MAGLWYEAFEVGMVFEHEWSRTLTETDNRWFSLLTMNTQPVHISVHAAEKTIWKKPLVNSLFTLGCMVGMTVNDTTFGTTVANLGMNNVKFPHPLFEGDTIRMRTTVLAKRESASRPGEGIVTLQHECFNQNDILCGICERAALMMKQPAAAA
jgi:acyl dehydratase